MAITKVTTPDLINLTYNNTDGVILPKGATIATFSCDYLVLAGGGGGGMNGGSGVVILRCTRPTATLSAGITVNSITGAGTVSGTAISGTSDYYYSATSGSGTITFN